MLRKKEYPRNPDYVYNEGGMKKPVIAITMGDPAGIGPEICLRALASHAVLKSCVPVLFAGADILQRVAEACGLKMPQHVMSLEQWRKEPAPEIPTIVHCTDINAAKIVPGRVQQQCGRAAYECVSAAAEAAMAGRVAAMATAPIHKEALRAAGIPYPGHTEILAHITKTKRFCMMMASDKMMVSLVTTHTSLANVSRTLSQQRIFDTIELTAETMTRLGIKKPRIAVCGLNPHAGEHGLFGREEEELISPAIKKACKKGLLIEGPLAPDTAFLPRKMETTDAYVAMYHDQGLIPFKMLAFDNGVNITLGLPVVRTSVDHGTAFDIAWQGIASPKSMIQSVLWALHF